MPGVADERIRARAADTGWDWKPEGVPVEFVSLTGKLGRAASGDGELVRAAAAGQGALAERDPDQRAHHGLQVRGRQPASAARLPRSPRRASVPRLGRRKARAGRSTVACRRQRWACCSGRWWSSKSQGAGQFFGEPEFDVKDMLRTTSDGRGIVTCLELPDVADKPRLVLDLHDVAAGGAVPQPA